MKNKISCVYKIENIYNGMIYIGQSVDYKHRICGHNYALRHNKHSNKLMQKHYNDMGSNCFRFSILEECDKKNLLELETNYINLFGGIECSNLYNKCDLSGHNKSYKENQAKAQLGVHTISESGKLRISLANKNKIITEEQKIKIRNNAKINSNYGMKNKKHSNEAKLKMHNAKVGMYKGSLNPNYKYTPDFINNLKKEYNICKNYAELGRRYNISPITISSLIRFEHS